MIALLALAVTTAFAEAPPLSLAIFDFDSKEETVRDMGSKLAILLNAQLSAEPNLLLVERAELEKALGEQELGLSGTVAAASAAKVGQLTGAKVLLTGKLFKLDKDLMAVAKIIGTETGRVYAETAKVPASGKTVDDLAAELARKVAATVTARADTLVARTPTREDRAEELKKVLKDAKRPAVAIRIPEQHFGSPVIDPAAQTELSLILQQCGFTLVDEKSTQPPDIEISGEAFSAYGLRRGHFISCKARVELKAQRKADGKVLAVDRQTTVAVDISEHIAAKNALQAAGAELALRLGPKLVQAAN